MMMNLMTVLVKKVFISSKPSIVCLLCPPPCGPFSIQESAVGGLSYKVKKNVPWHILAPRRGCFGNHLPLRRVRILAERFFIVRKRSFLTIKKRYLIPKGTGYPAVPPQLTCTLHVRSASVNAGPTLPYWGKAPRVGSKCSAQLLPPLQPL